jgi:lipopolysaccharide transport system ATP-binding protein
MAEPAIRVSHLSKQYKLGLELQNETLGDYLRQFGRRLRGQADSRPSVETILALNDVSFEVPTGQIVGIIGRNGSGKSTLLKILSRITAPTAGDIWLRGRISSMLEVGTGFHPELTGRQNIFMNGAILGMSRREIATRFDEIVEFAGIGKFIDTPVKRYSSGMYVRLAFAVSAHLEPEILLVDEVLAVGDVLFQQKSLRQLESTSSRGVTVLFVSHNMGMIMRLCNRVIYLDKGQVVKDGSPHEVAQWYLREVAGQAPERTWDELATAPGDEVVRLRAVRVLNAAGKVAETINIQEPVQLQMTFDVQQAGHVLYPNFFFYTPEGTCLFGSSEHDTEWTGRARPPGTYTSTVTIPGNFLAEGQIAVRAAISTLVHPPIKHVDLNYVISFQVMDTPNSGSLRGEYVGEYPGIIRPNLEWLTAQSVGM